MARFLAVVWSAEQCLFSIATVLKPLVRADHMAHAEKTVGGSGLQTIYLFHSSFTPFMAATSRHRLTAKVAESERSTISAKVARPNLRRFFWINEMSNMDECEDSPGNQRIVNALAVLSVARDVFSENLRFLTLR